MGLDESELIDYQSRAAYLLGLELFLQQEKGFGAWTFKRGIKAPQAAGIIIHSQTLRKASFVL